MTTSLKPEASVEINAEDAHIIIRTSDEATASRYVRSLFPDAEIEQLSNSKLVITKHFRDGKEPVGTISKYEVPSGWTTNRRVEKERAA